MYGRILTIITPLNPKVPGVSHIWIVLEIHCRIPPCPWVSFGGVPGGRGDGHTAAYLLSGGVFPIRCVYPSIRPGSSPCCSISFHIVRRMYRDNKVLAMSRNCGTYPAAYRTPSVLPKLPSVLPKADANVRHASPLPEVHPAAAIHRIVAPAEFVLNQRPRKTPHLYRICLYSAKI